MPRQKGRPRCKSLCCQEDGETVLYILYHTKGMSSRKIADLLEVSADHIVRKLHYYGVGVKDRGRPRGQARPRKSKLWSLTDQELFKTPIKELALKYDMSWSGVSYVKKHRRKEKVD